MLKRKTVKASQKLSMKYLQLANLSSYRQARVRSSRIQPFRDDLQNRIFNFMSVKTMISKQALLNDSIELSRLKCESISPIKALLIT